MNHESFQRGKLNAEMGGDIYLLTGRNVTLKMLFDFGLDPFFVFWIVRIGGPMIAK